MLRNVDKWNHNQEYIHKVEFLFKYWRIFGYCQEFEYCQAHFREHLAKKERQRLESVKKKI